MSDTPNTQAVIQAADGRWTYSIKHFCESMELRIKELENERDTALDDLEFRRGLFQLQEQQLNAVRASRDRLAEELKEAQDAIEMMLRDSSCRRIPAYTKEQLTAMEGDSDDH